MYQALTQDEWEYKRVKPGTYFVPGFASLELGSHAMVSDLVGLGIEYMFHYDLYEKELQITQMFPILDKEPEVPP